MIRRSVLLRLVLASAAVIGGLGVGLAVPEASADPGPCGFVALAKGGTTTTVPLGDFCVVDNCNGGYGPGHYQPPTGAGGVTVEAWGCLALP